MAISNEIVLLRDYQEGSEKRKPERGRTRLFSTGVPQLDEYLSGGFGRTDGYEIVVLFGATGVGKSKLALNFLRGALNAGELVGLMALEDDGEDIYGRMEEILGEKETAKFGSQIHCLPDTMLDKSWKLEELLVLIEQWYTERGISLIMLDHIQMAFESAETIKGESEYARQREFMQKLNRLVRRLRKTIILISHVSKDTSSKGGNRIIGSSSIAQAATKLIEVERGSSPSSIEIRMWKSRFTKTPDWGELYTFRGSRLEAEKK